ncbi:MAG TPA: hypothetical protein PKW55_01540 [Spirochaetota bacterium]|nr:hypothetical protein [Spirochaetota bacterium]HOM38900.1 hypothetical protein [Spirochaetota bacterium]HPQ49121.1 hypothetical protein [Spirochaetota bacterium]
MKNSLIYISLFLPFFLFSQQQDKGIPSSIVANLLNIYKTGNFKLGLEITTGKEKKAIQDIISLKDKNYGKLPENFQVFINRIDDLRIIDEVIKDNYAMVEVLWVLKIPDKDDTSRYTLKANQVAYLLEKINGKWYIKSSKMIKEHVFYNYKEFQEIQEKAKKYDEEKDKQENNKTK